MILTVAVAVAMSRPVRHEETIYVTLDAASEGEGSLLAVQMACTNPGVEMAVGCEIVAATY